MDPIYDIVPFRERRYEEITIDKVKVVNSRNRDQEQFDMNVESIDHVGLLKPIRVNDKFVERTGAYELICGRPVAGPQEARAGNDQSRGRDLHAQGGASAIADREHRPDRVRLRTHLGDDPDHGHPWTGVRPDHALDHQENHSLARHGMRNE